jgi:uncharacterized repeat protein (TIGR01451 family)
VTDRFSPWLEIFALEAPGSATADSESYPTAAITVTYANIPMGEQRLITVTAVVVSDGDDPPWQPVAGDLITNVATLAYGSVVTTSNEVTVTIVEPELVIVKVSDPPQSSTVAPGQAITYTVAVTNVGNSTAYRYSFEDVLPLGMQQITPTLVSVTIDGAPVVPSGYDAWIVTGTVFIAFEDWTPLPAGSVLQIVYVAYVDGDVAAGLDLTNTVSIDWMNLPPDNGPDWRVYPPVTDTNTVHVGYPALALVKSAAPATVESGEQLTYTLTVSNPGVFDLTGVVVTDVVPANTTFITATLPHTGPAPDNTPGSVITWTLGDLDAGATRVLTMVVRLDDLLFDGTLITNTAWVTSTEALTDTDTIVTPVGGWHSLAITKTADPAVVRAGDLLTYTLAWSVDGNEPALGVTISDTVPADTAFDSCSGGLACAESAGLVMWTLGDQNPPVSGVVTLVVRVDSAAPTGTLLYNAALITDTQGLTDTDEVTTPVLVDVEIWVEKTGSTSPVTPGGVMTYSLTVTNDGPSDAEDVVVTDTLPAEVTFIAANPPQAGGPNPLVWNLGTLTPGESREHPHHCDGQPGRDGGLHQHRHHHHDHAGRRFGQQRGRLVGGRVAGRGNLGGEDRQHIAGDAGRGDDLQPHRDQRRAVGCGERRRDGHVTGGSDVRRRQPAASGRAEPAGVDPGHVDAERKPQHRHHRNGQPGRDGGLHQHRHHHHDHAGRRFGQQRGRLVGGRVAGRGNLGGEDRQRLAGDAGRGDDL